MKGKAAAASAQRRAIEASERATQLEAELRTLKAENKRLAGEASNAAVLHRSIADLTERLETGASYEVDRLTAMIGDQQIVIDGLRERVGVHVRNAKAVSTWLLDNVTDGGIGGMEKILGILETMASDEIDRKALDARRDQVVYDGPGQRRMAQTDKGKAAVRAIQKARGQR